MNKRIVHDALILTAFTLVLGFILALVQGITAEPIDKANKAAAQKAYQAVFSDAKSFEKYDYDADEAYQLHQHHNHIQIKTIPVTETENRQKISLQNTEEKRNKLTVNANRQSPVLICKFRY